MQPFLKWAGGKRWLAPTLLQRIPNEFNRYFEPFLGGGAVFFHLRPTSALLSDKNQELIDTYFVVRDHPEELSACLEEHQASHSDEYYYEVRESSPRDNVEKAGRFLYLNRTCWNGLYRVNRQGKFNVPRGTKDSIVIEGEDFKSVSAILKDLEIECSDFSHAIDRSGEGDIVYVDPPYTVKHNVNGFLKYNEEIFSWADQVRLKEAIDRARARGATVIASNADHSSIWDLYADATEVITMSRASVISGPSSGRSKTTELLAIFDGHK